MMMAYSHNLSDPSDITTGFDPVLGLAGTIGMTYVIRQIFGGLTAFDSNMQEVTASNTACPTWLQALSGNLLGTVSQSSTDANIYLRFFRLDDPGLTASPPNCMMYRWQRLNYTATERNRIWHRMEYAVSGVGVKTEVTGTGSSDLWRYSFESGRSYSLYHTSNYSSSDPNVFPKVMYWKSDNANFLMGIDKADNSHRGGGCISFHPNFSGYTLTGSVSGDIHIGENLNTIFYIGLGGGCGVFDGPTTEQRVDKLSKPSEVSVISSVGKLPSLSLSLSGQQRIVVSKFAMALQTDNNVITAVSEAMDSAYLVHNDVGGSGEIVLYNSNYWLLDGYINDGLRTFDIALQLSG